MSSCLMSLTKCVLNIIVGEGDIPTTQLIFQNTKRNTHQTYLFKILKFNVHKKYLPIYFRK